MPQLDGKVALVTGGGRGLGRGISLELARRGAKVVVADFFNDDSGFAADNTAAEITAAGGAAHPNHGNVASFEGAQAIVDETVSVFGGLDILVNCAGNFAFTGVLEVEEAEWDSIIGVHVTGHAGCIKAASAQMAKQGRGGRIITVSSRGSFWSSGISYATAKAAIMGLTASMALYLKSDGITVNCVLPSATTQLFPSDGSMRTLGGMPVSHDMDPDHVAPVVAYLCTPDAGEITGKYWYSSGGDITFYTHPLMLQNTNLFVRKSGVWDVDELEQVLPPLLGTRGHKW